MRTVQVLTRLLEALLEEGQSRYVVMLIPAQTTQGSLYLLGRQEDVVAVLADHLQDLDEVLEETNVVDGQAQLQMPEVPHTPLQTLPTRPAAHQLRPHTQAQVERPVLHRLQRSLVKLPVGDLGLGDLHDAGRRKHGEIDGFAE